MGQRPNLKADQDLRRSVGLLSFFKCPAALQQRLVRAAATALHPKDVLWKFLLNDGRKTAPGRRCWRTGWYRTRRGPGSA